MIKSVCVESSSGVECGVEEGQVEWRRARWSGGGPGRVVEGQVEWRRARWSGGGPGGVEEGQVEQRLPQLASGGYNRQRKVTKRGERSRERKREERQK
ncbi:hypothetical protein Pmani_028259 [Petrolisthes manimaculis]|uniref:Uncharacterized protein n=1 Tax=Petrolisthes manimaculis TaxID=1843537 RepID=A0AAE1P1F4_9EUCA|nr:hypothetical protein Pmani_028259 [Petrolisthes manimaculis]